MYDESVEKKKITKIDHRLDIRYFIKSFYTINLSCSG